MKTNRRNFLLGALGVGLLSTSLLALPLPQVVSHTVQAVTATDIEQIVIRRKSDGTLVAMAYFNLKDAGGTPRGIGNVNVDLNGAQTTSIQSFATSVLVPAMNAQ